MLYRIYDYEQGKWLDDAVILPNGNLQIFKKNKIFGVSKTHEYNCFDYQYNVDLSTGLLDKNGDEIYENDILEVGNVTGLVYWAQENAEYELLDFENHLFYPLWGALCYKHSIILGNIEDNPTLIPRPIDLSLPNFEIGGWANAMKGEKNE